MINIRSFKAEDLQDVIKLFKEAVSAINKRDYSPEQISTWIDIDFTRWHEKLINHITFVAEIDSVIVGFADISREGYLDHMYIHKDYQARFASLHLLRAVEKAARELGLSKIFTDCSITAKIPAERVGFKIVEERVVERKGVQFVVYRMEKKL
jgi:putative acetyltransferase